MAVQIKTTRRVAIDVAGETVVFICRIPSAQELSKFLNGRFTQKRNKVESRVYEARAEFIDKILVDVEGAEFEGADKTIRPLNAQTVLTEDDKVMWRGIMGTPVETWKDLIQLSWKSSAALRFEDSSNEGDDEKN